MQDKNYKNSHMEAEVASCSLTNLKKTLNAVLRYSKEDVEGERQEKVTMRRKTTRFRRCNICGSVEWIRRCADCGKAVCGRHGEVEQTGKCLLHAEDAEMIHLRYCGRAV